MGDGILFAGKPQEYKSWDGGYASSVYKMCCFYKLLESTFIKSCFFIKAKGQSLAILLHPSLGKESNRGLKVLFLLPLTGAYFCPPAGGSRSLLSSRRAAPDFDHAAPLEVGLFCFRHPVGLSLRVTALADIPWAAPSPDLYSQGQGTEFVVPFWHMLS